MKFLEKEKLDGLANEEEDVGEVGKRRGDGKSKWEKRGEKEDVCVIIAPALRQTGGIVKCSVMLWKGLRNSESWNLAF